MQRKGNKLGKSVRQVKSDREGLLIHRSINGYLCIYWESTFGVIERLHRQNGDCEGAARLALDRVPLQRPKGVGINLFHSFDDFLPFNCTVT